jgi:hypothetical protein
MPTPGTPTVAPKCGSVIRALSPGCLVMLAPASKRQINAGNTIGRSDSLRE